MNDLRSSSRLCLRSHSTTKFLFKKYIYSHLTTYFLFTKIFTHIYRCIYSHSTVYIRSHSQSLLVNSKVIASCYVSYGGQESHQRIRKGRDGHGLENPTDVKKNAKRIQKLSWFSKSYWRNCLLCFHSQIIVLQRISQVSMQRDSKSDNAYTYKPLLKLILVGSKDKKVITPRKTRQQRTWSTYNHHVRKQFISQFNTCGNYTLNFDLENAPYQAVTRLFF